MKPEHQVCIIYAGVNGYLDKMETSKIPKFEVKFLEYMTNSHQALFDEIRNTTVLSEKNAQLLGDTLKEWIPLSGLV